MRRLKEPYIRSGEMPDNFEDCIKWANRINEKTNKEMEEEDNKVEDGY